MLEVLLSFVRGDKTCGVIGVSQHVIVLHKLPDLCETYLKNRYLHVLKNYERS